MKLTLVIVHGRVCEICDEIEACTVGSSCADLASQYMKVYNLEFQIVEESMTTYLGYYIRSLWSSKTYRLAKDSLAHGVPKRHLLSVENSVPYINGAMPIFLPQKLIHNPITSQHRIDSTLTLHPHIIV